MKIYTRTGDEGDTSLYGGTRISKDDPRIAAYGTVDELNSFIGLARALWSSGAADSTLHRIQCDLFDIGACLASPGSDTLEGVQADRIAKLEEEIDRLESSLRPLHTFVLPGGSPAASCLHVARTVCRRAERHVVALHDPDPRSRRSVVYLNRLSDYLFVAARTANHLASVPDVPWQRQASPEGTSR